MFYFYPDEGVWIRQSLAGVTNSLTTALACWTPGYLPLLRNGNHPGDDHEDGE